MIHPMFPSELANSPFPKSTRLRTKEEGLQDKNMSYEEEGTKNPISANNEWLEPPNHTIPPFRPQCLYSPYLVNKHKAQIQRYTPLVRTVLFFSISTSR